MNIRLGYAEQTDVGKVWNLMKSEKLSKKQCFDFYKILYAVCVLSDNTVLCRKKAKAMYEFCIKKKTGYIACKNKPCGNNGICLSLAYRSYMCDCNRGFKGKLCDEKISPCENFKCGQHGVCVVENDKPKCVCDTKNGWFGLSCQYRNVLKFYCWNNKEAPNADVKNCPIQPPVYVCMNNKPAPNNDPSKCEKKMRPRMQSLHFWWLLAVVFFAFGIIFYFVYYFKRNFIGELNAKIFSLQKSLSEKNQKVEELNKTNQRLLSGQFDAINPVCPEIDEVEILENQKAEQSDPRILKAKSTPTDAWLCMKEPFYQASNDKGKDNS